MSSKLFTWTKSGRKNTLETLRSPEIAPIPAECFPFKGVEHPPSMKVGYRASKSFFVSKQV